MSGSFTIDELAHVIAQHAGVNVDHADWDGDPTFAELGIDSLGRLGIIAELERRLGISLEGPIEGCTTPLELLRYVNAQPTLGV
jgi:minimal PKS acyl carrier protein